VITIQHAAYVLGGAATILGAQLSIDVRWGAVLALNSAVVIVAAGVWLRDLVLLGGGALLVVGCGPHRLSASPWR
jgi:hypothetical protein